ncbi:uncharacterized protein PS065_021880 [Dugong dugon]
MALPSRLQGKLQLFPPPGRVRRAGRRSWVAVFQEPGDPPLKLALGRLAISRHLLQRSVASAPHCFQPSDVAVSAALASACPPQACLIFGWKVNSGSGFSSELEGCLRALVSGVPPVCQNNNSGSTPVWLL